MQFVIAANRPSGMTGRSYLRGFRDGVPWTTPFEAEAARMHLTLAWQALRRTRLFFHGFGVERVAA